MKVECCAGVKMVLSEEPVGAALAARSKRGNMKKSLLFIALAFIFTPHVFAKDSVYIEKKAFDQDSKAAQLREKVNADKFKSTEAMDKGHKDTAVNKSAIEAFMARYISTPFGYLENVVGVEINFNKIFYSPEILSNVTELVDDIAVLDKELRALEAEIAL